MMTRGAVIMSPMVDTDVYESYGKQAEEPAEDEDRLMVGSVEKAFRVLHAFDGTRQSLGLSQIAAAAGLNLSAAQRFTHTLVKLGYLDKDPETKRFRLSVRVLEFAYSYRRSNVLVERAVPYMAHLNKSQEETVNLSLLDGTEVIVVARFMSRHILNTDVITGTRLPAFCTAPGVAMLSRLPEDEIDAILDKSDLRPHTPMTIWKKDQVIEKIKTAYERGYAASIKELFLGDYSFASPILNHENRPIAAINIAASSSRYTPDEAEERFSPLVVAAAASISQDFVSQA